MPRSRSRRSRRKPIFRTPLSYEEIQELDHLQKEVKHLFHSYSIRSMDDLTPPVRARLQHLVDSYGGYHSVMSKLATLTPPKHLGSRLTEWSAASFDAAVSVARGSFFVGAIFADTSSATSFGSALAIRAANGVVLGAAIGLPLIALGGILYSAGWLSDRIW